MKSVVGVAAFDLECWSCRGIILTGQAFRNDIDRRPPRGGRRARFRKAIVRHRHVHCPKPPYQVSCPHCLADIREPCVARGTMRTIKQPHWQRWKETIP